MRAFHTLWSKPLLYGRHKSALEEKFSISTYTTNSDFDFPDYDILLTILSVLKWKQLNGIIGLYGDKTSINKFSELGILDLWDDYNSDVFENIEVDKINPTLFWSAGKFFAYLNEKAPCVYLDTDLIVWQNLEHFYSKVDLRFLHWESTEESRWYCKKQNLRKSPTYQYKNRWNWNNIKAHNAAIIYFNNEEFKNYYAQEAISYMSNNTKNVDFLSADTPELLFVEQILLPLCAKEKKITALPFIDLTWSPSLSCFLKDDPNLEDWIYFSPITQPLITHAWFYKRNVEGNLAERNKYCLDLVKVILEEFPSQIVLLEKIECLTKYLRLIK